MRDDGEDYEGDDEPDGEPSDELLEEEGNEGDDEDAGTEEARLFYRLWSRDSHANQTQRELGKKSHAFILDYVSLHFWSFNLSIKPP